ncbi:MAG: hypothetical protein AB7R90_19325 [Reyranellaceae bacterium]
MRNSSSLRHWKKAPAACRAKAAAAAVGAFVAVIAPAALAQLYKTEIRDDPFRPHVQYESESHSVNVDPDTTRIFVLVGIVDRKTAERKYLVQWSAIYRDRSWRRFSGAALEGGEMMEFLVRSRDVSSCVAAFRTCLYDEFAYIYLSEAQMRRGAKEGITFKVFSQGGSKDIVSTIPAGMIASLLDTMPPVPAPPRSRRKTK